MAWKRWPDRSLALGFCCWGALGVLSLSLAAGWLWSNNLVGGVGNIVLGAYAFWCASDIRKRIAQQQQ